jgi:nucleoside-diphosphate-sugar epimerase
MIRWITDRLGTCAYDQRPDGDYQLIDVRHLVDKGGNSSAAIAQCIEAGIAALNSGRTVVVACDFGVSRSNSIAAGILSVGERCSFDEGVARVLAATGESEIKLEMMESVRAVLPSQASARAETLLVTGGSGFLGRSLVPRLQKTHRVVAPPRSGLNVEQGAVALAAYCRAEGISQIVHLAYPRVYTNVGAMAAGLAMLRTVLDTCKLLDIGLLFVSSWVVFGGYAADNLIADETLPLRPKGVYSDSKYLEELLVAEYARRSEIKHSTCRLAPVYGPGCDRPRLIRAFYEALLAGKTIHTHRYRNGVPKLDLLYVGDAVEAIAKSASYKSRETFHFGSGQLHSTAEIAGIIANLLSVPLHREEIPIEDDVANIQMDTSKAERLLGWAPLTGLREGLSQTLKIPV